MMIWVFELFAFQKELKKDEKMNQVSNILGAMELKKKEIILGWYGWWVLARDREKRKMVYIRKYIFSPWSMSTNSNNSGGQMRQICRMVLFILVTKAVCLKYCQTIDCSVDLDGKQIKSTSIVIGPVSIDLYCNNLQKHSTKSYLCFIESNYLLSSILLGLPPENDHYLLK